MTKRLELPKFQAFDSNGDPLSGGLVYTYEAGTTTLKTTYSDYDASTENTNPVVLNSRGEADIYVNGTYKIVLKDSALVEIWTLDNVQGGVGADALGENYYYPDATATDQGVTGSSNTITYAVDTISTDNGTIYLKHDGGTATTTYTLTTSESIPSNVNIIKETGAVLDGAGTLTLANTSQIDASPTQKIFGSSITVTFLNGGTVYPEWWGENTTPGTTDMTSEIQSAIDSLPRGNVLFNGETYLISSPIVPETGISFIGSKESTTIKLDDNSDDDMVDFTGTDTDVGFYDITFDNNGANQTKSTSTNTIHATTQVKRLTIKNCTFKNAANNAIRLDASLAHEDVIVLGNRFADYYQAGVVFYGVIGGEISDNRFDNTGITPAGNGNGISISNISTDITVSGNAVTMADSGAESFGIETGTAGTTKITIVGNVVDCGDYSNNGGISVANTTNSGISGNSITKVQKIAAIEVSNSSIISVSGNSISDIDKPGVALNADNHSVVVIGNTIDTYSEQGISIVRSTGSQANMYGISIVGNVLTNGSGAAASGEHSIYVNGGPARGLVISNNVVYDNAGAYGMNIIANVGETHTGYIVSGNSFYNVLTYWLGLGGSGTHASYAIVGNSAVTAGTSSTPGAGHSKANNIEV